MAEIKLKKRYKYVGDIFQKLIGIGFNVETATAFLNEVEGADVAEVKHGEWVLKSEIHRYSGLDDVDEEFYVECPLCRRTEYVPFEFDDREMLKYAKEHYPYCHCGAKMAIAKNATTTERRDT